VEVLAGEQKPTVIGFLARAVAWLNGQGIQVPPGSLRQWLRLAPRGLAMQPARRLGLKADPH